MPRTGKKKRGIRRIKSTDERFAPEQNVNSPVSFQDAMMSPEERLRREQEQADAERRERYRKLRNKVAGADATESDEKTEETPSATDADQSQSDIPPFDVAAVKASFDFDVDWALDKLNSLHEDWDGRVEIVNNVINTIISPDTTTDDFHQKLSVFIEAIGRQFADRRSLPTVQLSEALVRLVEAHPAKFQIFVPFMLRSLFTCMAVRIEIMREKADELGTCMVTKCAYSHGILLAVYDGLQHRHGETRTFCAKYLTVLLGQIPQLEVGESETRQEHLLQLLDQAVRLAVTDASSDCRQNGYRALHAYERVAPRSAEAIINEMSKAVRRRYETMQRRRSSVG